jgi:hypothetical protein
MGNFISQCIYNFLILELGTSYILPTFYSKSIEIEMSFWGRWGKGALNKTKKAQNKVIIGNLTNKHLIFVPIEQIKLF